MKKKFFEDLKNRLKTLGLGCFFEFFRPFLTSKSILINFSSTFLKFEYSLWSKIWKIGEKMVTFLHFCIFCIFFKFFSNFFSNYVIPLYSEHFKLSHKLLAIMSKAGQIHLSVALYRGQPVYTINKTRKYSTACRDIKNLLPLRFQNSG